MSHISYNVLQTNNTDVDQVFREDQNLNQPLLAAADQYTVGITHLEIPTGRIQSFLPDDLSKYYLGIKYLGNRYTAQLPSMKYYNQNQLLDCLSRCLQQTYLNYAKSFGNDYKYSLTFGQTSGVSKVTSMLMPFSVNITNAATANLAAIEVKLFDAFVSDNQIEGAPPYATPVVATNSNITISLVAPSSMSSKKIVLWKGSSSDFKPSFLNNSTFVMFSEAGSMGNGRILDTTVTKTVYPQQALYSYNSVSSQINPNGTWNLQIESDNIAYYMMLSYATLNIYTVPNGLPVTAPQLLVNPSTNHIQLTYQDSYPVSGMTICMSPRVYGMLYFGEQFHSYDAVNNDFDFIYPEYTPGANISGMTIVEQQASSITQLSNINRILVQSYSVCCDGELYSSNNVVSTQNILSDFTIDTSSLGDSTLLYSTDASAPSPWRTYRMRLASSLNKIDMTISIEYKNGLTLPLMISPGNSVNARLSFFPYRR